MLSNKPKHETYTLYLYVVCVWGLGLTRLLTNLGCYQRLGGYAFVMSCWYFDLDLFNPTIVMCLICSIMCVDLLIFIAFQCSCVTLRWMYDLLDLTSLSPRSIIFEFLSSQFDRTEVFVCLFLVMSCCDMFDLTIMSLWLVLFLGWFPVARRELMWILWIIFWCFPVACIGLR